MPNSPTQPSWMTEGNDATNNVASPVVLDSEEEGEQPPAAAASSSSSNNGYGTTNNNNNNNNNNNTVNNNNSYSNNNNNVPNNGNKSTVSSPASSYTPSWADEQNQNQSNQQVHLSSDSVLNGASLESDDYKIRALNKQMNAKKKAKKYRDSDIERGAPLLSDNESSDDEYPKPTPLRRSFLHDMFIGLCVVSVLASFCLVVANVLSILYKTDMRPIQLFMRAYSVIFGIAVVFCEMNWTSYTRESKLLNNWISRGFLYTFLGVLGLDESVAVSLDGSNLPNPSIVEMFAKISSYCMVGVGVLYVLLGLMCCRAVKERRVAAFVAAKKQRAADEARRDLERHN